MLQENHPKIRLQDNSFLQDLRQSTSIQHKRLEDLPVSRAIMSDELDLHSYTRYLASMQDVMKAYDQQIVPLIRHILPPSAQEKKSDRIKDDLEFMVVKGATPPAESEFTFPSENGEAALMGISYVIEGSGLGGRVILKHVESVLGLNQNEGASYFYGYGECTGSNWKAFLDSLVKYSQTSNEQHLIIKGAQQAFDLIHDHLIRYGESYEN